MITNLFKDIPTNLPEEFFTQLLENKNVRIERIVSEGHGTPAGEWHDQLQNEWVIVLQGEAMIEYENAERQTLNVGDFLFIPAHTRHRVSWTTAEQQTVWLAIHWL
jgi:cupin 2 domain-containing protein